MKICEFLISAASGKANFSFEVLNFYQSYVRLRLSIEISHPVIEKNIDQRRKDLLDRWSWRIPGRKSASPTDGFSNEFCNHHWKAVGNKS